MIRIVNRLINVVLVATLLLPMSASALSQTQTDVLNSGSYYYDVNGTSSSGGSISGCSVSGDQNNPLYGLKFPPVSDVNDLINRINNYIKSTQPSSPFVGLGSNFVAAGKKYNVNPAMMVGIANKEEQLATTSEPVVVVNHNSFGITGIAGLPNYKGYTVFPSFAGSIDPATSYVSSTYVNDPKSPYYSTTLLEMMQHYTPPDPEGATQATLGPMHNILDGIVTNNNGSTPPSASGCDSIGSILQTIQDYAWPDYEGKDSFDPSSGLYVKAKDAYLLAMQKAQQAGTYVGDATYLGADCGGFVTRVMQDSGADPSYNDQNGPTSAQQAYMDAHPDKYKKLGESTTGDFINQLKLQPGDIAITPNHTYFYVGNAIPGWGGNTASASQASRTAMASTAYPADSEENIPFTWYRLIQ